MNKKITDETWNNILKEYHNNPISKGYPIRSVVAINLLEIINKHLESETAKAVGVETDVINFLAGKTEGLGKRPALKDYALMRSVDILNMAHNMFANLHWGDKNGITTEERTELLDITERIANRLYSEMSWYKESQKDL